jgi:hypothetical protein
MTEKEIELDVEASYKYAESFRLYVFIFDLSVVKIVNTTVFGLKLNTEIS